jgi:hypothetical protein
VTFGTKNDKFLGLFGDDDHRIDGGELVSNHEYFLSDVLQVDGHTFYVLHNPWGSGQSQAPYEVTIPEEDVDDYFNEVSVG